MSAKPSDDAQTSLLWVSRCKGTKKNEYAQEKCNFFAIFSLFAPMFRVQKNKQS